MHPPEKVDQMLSLRLGKSCESLVTDLGREFEDPGKDRACFRGQDEATSAPVSRIGTSLDPAVLLHAIDLSNQGHWFDFKQIGEARLVNALVTGKIPEHLALRPSKTEAEKRTLVKTATEQASDVVNKKPKAAVQIHG